MLARLLSTSTSVRSTFARRHAPTAALAASVVTGVLLFAATPAGATVTRVETSPGNFTEVGLQPRSELYGEGKAETFANNNGNAIVDGSSVYTIYWDPTDVFNQHHEWLTNIDTFFHAMGENSGNTATIFGPLGEYRERSNAGAVYSTVFKGAYTDSTSYPSPGCSDPEPLALGALTCLTDAQLREQLQSFIATHGLPKGMHTIYYLITPPGVPVCLDAAASHCSDYSLTKTEAEKEEHNSESYKHSFCSYHGIINPDAATEGDGNTILYAAIPWSVGTLGDAYQVSKARVYADGYDCQDGGWNAENNKEIREKERALSTEEETKLAAEPPAKREELEEIRRLEGPHQEEPNQEGKGELGDYSPGLSDLIINQIAEEQANIVTDPLLNAWQDEEHHELTDECRDVFGNTVNMGVGGTALANLNTFSGTLFNQTFGEAHYYINNVFNLGDGSCAGGVALVPRFTAPNPVKTNESVAFDGLESTVGLMKGEVFGPSGPPAVTYATFHWNFGDGSEASGFAPNSPPCELPWLSPCAGSVFHSYQYGGTYQVTLTVTDVAGNTTSVTHEVTVNGSPPPSSPSGSGTQSMQGTPSSQSSGSSSSNGVTPSVPAPIAAATIVPQSLRKALHKGLLVSYSVNEQVAGRFEVLLSRAVARRLGISGTPATGMPAGSPPQLVIAKAILVTTKGGHSSVRIEFSKRTAARLAHAHKVALTLRLTVHNASSSNPATTTVVSAVTLGG
ncbi:MAG TPA: PKD domain-containing protein [Solirubrobacteraceae bacterium]